MSVWWCDECWIDGGCVDGKGRIVANAADLPAFDPTGPDRAAGLKACPVCGSALLEVDEDRPS